MPAPELRSELRWLSTGFLLTLSSGFGQTYFIGLFAGHFKSDLALTDGAFGGLYTVATLVSAVLLIWAGKLADRFSTRALGAGVMAGLAATSLALASIDSAWALGFALLGLRFFGQGMLPHVAMTAVGRWFNRKRGRAVAITALGFPAGEAVLPIAAVAAVGLIGWRQTWVAAAMLLLAVAIPSLIVLLDRERVPASGPAVSDGAQVPSARAPTLPAIAAGARGASSEQGHEELNPAGRPEVRPVGRHWTRAQVLRSPMFYALMPVVLANSFIITGLFFNQVEIAATKGWTLSWFAASFPVLAAVHVFAALLAGWIVDRLGARRLLPLFLVPLGLAALLLTSTRNPYLLPVFMVLVGLTHGSSSTLQGALWPELYGTRHLGAIRALVTAGVVFASALSPALMGFLLDAGVTLEAMLGAMAAYCFIAATWVAALMPRLNRLAAVAFA